jgi:hypothetical protein
MVTTCRPAKRSRSSRIAARPSAADGSTTSPACSRSIRIAAMIDASWTRTASSATSSRSSRTAAMGCRPVTGARTRLLLTAAPSGQAEQSTATSRAAQTPRIRMSARRPILLTRTARDTLSTESRFTAERRGTGSASGSSTTSLGSPRMVVVHGATNARRRRGIAASRDSTTTGRRPISAISHHQTSPRAGIALTRPLPPAATTPGHPTRRAH